jgi:hypothetical protein
MALTITAYNMMRQDIFIDLSLLPYAIVQVIFLQLPQSEISCLVTLVVSRFSYHFD